MDSSPQASASRPLPLLPDEIWVEIMGRLPAKDIGRLVCASQGLHRLSQLGWRAACFRRWPRWSAIAGTEGHAALWRRQYELLGLREAEVGILPDVAAIRRLQQSITARHRAILTEWLCEVGLCRPSNG